MNIAHMYPLGPRKFVRSTASAGDIRTFDSGTMYVCSVDGGAGAAGKLWVDYEVDLFIPQTVPGSLVGTATSFFKNTVVTLPTTVPTLIPFGTISVDALRVYNVATITLPPSGCYNIDAILQVNDTATETLTVTVEIYTHTVAVDSYTYIFAAMANCPIAVPYQAYRALDGIDTVGIRVTAVGAAGTITCPAAGSTLRYSLA